MQLSFSVDEATSNKIEEAARRKSMSKSRFIVNCIDAYFRNEHSEDVKLMQLQTEISLRDEIIKMRDESLKQNAEVINELQASLNFLRHEYSILSQKLLLPAKMSVWSRIKNKLQLVTQ